VQTMAVRRAEIKDVSIIVRLWKEFMLDHDKEVLAKHPQFKPYQERKKMGYKNFEAFAAKNIKSKESIVLIAEVDGRAAGYCLAYIKENIPVFKLTKLGYISDMFVKKEFRNLRLSSAFKDETLKWFKEKGINHVSLAVNDGNDYARAVYRKWGFEDYHIEMRKGI
jgi:GNAT superfamily N-acetyltransferase